MLDDALKTLIDNEIAAEPVVLFQRNWPVLGLPGRWPVVPTGIFTAPVPLKFASPVIVGLAAGANPRFADPIPPTAETATQALFAALRMYKVLSPVSTYH